MCNKIIHASLYILLFVTSCCARRNDEIKTAQWKESYRNLRMSVTTDYHKMLHERNVIFLYWTYTLFD